MPRLKLLLVMMLSAALAACGTPPDDPEAQIRALLAGAEQAAEAGSTGDLLDYIADDYRDAADRDRQKLGLQLRAYFYRYPEPGLLTRVENIRFPYRDFAQVTLVVAMRDGLRDAGVYRIELDLRLQDDEWLVTAARWQRANSADLL